MGLFSALRARRRERRGREREEQLAYEREMEEEARLQAEQQAASPFAGLPFGNLFEQMMLGGGGWTRAIEYDPETGQWVDVSDARPEPPQESATQPPAAPGRAPRRGPPPHPPPPAH